LFKLIGAVIGWYVSGSIIGGIAGYFCVSVLQRFLTLGAGGINPLSHRQRQDIFLKTLFTLKGKLAKADGHISQDEISHVELFMQQTGMSAEHRQEAIALFKQGASTDFDIEPTLKSFLDTCGTTSNLTQMLLVYLIVMALADGRIDSAEDKLLRFIAGYLGYGSSAFDQLLNMVLNQTHFSGSQGNTTSPQALDEAYSALGVSREHSDKEIKRAYRKLMSQYHPDKLVGQGLPDDMVAVATERAKDVQIAYDLIKKSREN